MARRWNLSLWAGFLLVLAAPSLFGVVFFRFPATRAFPCPPFLLLAAGLTLMTLGLRRAYREPHLYRGKIVGTILAAVGVAIFALFGWGAFYFARQLPPSTGAPQVGQKAPDFTLPDKDGHPVTLSELLASGERGSKRVSGVVLVFYRGYW